MMICSLQMAAQNWDRLDVRFREDGKVLANAGVNGLVTPDFSNYDFNGDGLMDVFAFDRQSGAVMAFVWDTGGEEGELVYAPQYAENFPKMTEFAKTIDYDRDGDHDLFTYAQGQGLQPSAIVLFKNVGTDAAPIFEMAKFPEFKADVLYFTRNSEEVEIYVTVTDIPSIVDEDGDGDYDIIAFESEAAERMILYTNLQKELGLPKDSMHFEVPETCWGRFRESGLNADILLSSEFDGCGDTTKIVGAGGSDARHAGSTHEVLDLDGDGDMDVLIGDLSSNSLVALYNSPQSGVTYMTSQDLPFPSYDVPVSISVFVNPSYVDVNADGKRDLVVSPNDTNSADNFGHIWLYENVGTDAAPIFEFRTDEFLYESSLRIPERSKPAFVDINQDGLTDIVVGSRGYYTGGTLRPRLFYYENKGTATQPEYVLEDGDYLSFSQELTTSVLHPAFGDVDNDGDPDLMVGEQEGKLYYFENTGGAGQPCNFSMKTFPYSNIDINRKSKPYFADLDQDGLVDLIVGEERDNTDPTTGRLGGLNYFRNMSAETPDSIYHQQPVTTTLGGVFTRLEGASTGSSSPTVIPTSTGDDYIFVVGSRRGEVFIYDGVVDNLADTFNLVTNDAPIPCYGGFTGVDLADIDNDNYYEMVVGNDNGGLAFHNTPYQVSEGSSTDVTTVQQAAIHPVPASDAVYITSTGTISTYKIIQADGKIVRSSQLVGDSISVAALAPGFYVMLLTVDGQEEAHKLLVTR